MLALVVALALALVLARRHRSRDGSCQHRHTKILLLQLLVQLLMQFLLPTESPRALVQERVRVLWMALLPLQPLRLMLLPLPTPTEIHRPPATEPMQQQSRTIRLQAMMAMMARAATATGAATTMHSQLPLQE